jgi:hypothetical protein
LNSNRQDPGSGTGQGFFGLWRPGLPDQIQKPLLEFDDFEKLNKTFRLREESRMRHSDLVRTSRPNVSELVEQATILKKYFDNRFIDPDGRVPYETSEVTAFKHQIGDGLHYIDNRIIWRDGSEVKPGSTSECCILKSVYIISARHRVGRLAEMWNAVYADDPLSREDLTNIIAIGVYFTEPFIPVALENILDASADLRAIKCDALADLLEERVLPKLGSVL